MYRSPPETSRGRWRATRSGDANEPALPELQHLAAERGARSGGLTVLPLAPPDGGPARDPLPNPPPPGGSEPARVGSRTPPPPLSADAGVGGGGVGDRLFTTGLCLPSGSSMTNADVDRVITVARDTLTQHERHRASSSSRRS